jgi:biotin carboxyl carrier protein
MRLDYRAGERLVSLEISGSGRDCRVLLDGAPVDATLLDASGAELWLGVAGRRVRALVARDGPLVHVHVDGRVFTFQRPGEDDVAEEVPLGGPRVTAPLPGKIVKVLVGAGQAVAAGEPLLILEAMKMETEIAAPLAGTVAAVHVQAGGTVALGDPLVDAGARRRAPRGRGARRRGRRPGRLGRCGHRTQCAVAMLVRPPALLPRCVVQAIRSPAREKSANPSKPGLLVTRSSPVPSGWIRNSSKS